MNQSTEQQVSVWVDQKLHEEGWEDCFLIDANVHGKKIEVFLDSDSGISFDRCKKMSRHLEAQLDEMMYLEGKYILEVSSPGVDRPIRLLRQLKRHQGRSFQFFFENREPFVAELTEVDGENLTLTYPHPEKKKETIQETLTFNDLNEAVVQISFKKKKKKK